MSTTIHSDKTVRGRSAYLAIGVDSEGCWHNHRTTDGTIIVTDASGIVWVEHLGGRDVAEWVEHIDAERGWQDHPDADPNRHWLEAAV